MSWNTTSASETPRQAVMVRLDDDLLPYLLGSARGQFAPDAKPVWKKEASSCLVLTAEGYPGQFEKGKTIEGMEDALSEDGVFLFHSGTAKMNDGRWVTNGGRVLNVCARAKNLSEALQKARDAAEKIRFDGKHYRRDVGKKALEILRERTGSGLG